MCLATLGLRANLDPQRPNFSGFQIWEGSMYHIHSIYFATSQESMSTGGVVRAPQNHDKDGLLVLYSILVIYMCPLVI